MQSKSIIDVASQINSFYNRKGFIDPSEYVLTLYLLCIYREEVIIGGKNSYHLAKDILAKDQISIKEELADLLPYFSVLDFFTTNELESIFEDLAQIDSNLYLDSFPEVFDKIFQYITDSNSYKNGAFVIQPKMVNLIMNFAEVHHYQNVYNPFASNAGFPVTLKHDVLYFGQEYNERIWRVGKLRLYAYSKNKNFLYSQESSLEHWANEKKYDLIFSRLPLLNNIDVKDEDGSQIDLENFVIKKSLESVSDEGKVILLLKPSFLSSSKNKNKKLFKFLVDQNLVEKIMIFPNGVFRHTQISINAIVLSKNKTNENIEFIDLTNFLETSRTRKLNIDWENVEFSNHLFAPWNSVSVTKETIEKNEYNLYGKQYFLENINGVALKDLVEISNGRRDEKNDINRIINIKDLSDDPIKTKFNSDFLRQDEIVFDKNRYRVIDDEGILVSLIGGKLKPTLFDGKIASLISSRIVQLKIKNDKVVLYKYLAQELSKDYVLKQVEAFSNGQVQTVISRKQLGEIIIKLPSVEIQKKEIEIRYDDLLSEVSSEYLVKEEDLRYNLKESQIENKALLRHKIAGPVSNLEFYSEKINRILTEKLLPLYPDLFALKLNENQILNLGQLLENLSKDAKKITNEIRDNEGELKVYEYHLSEIDIIPWIKKYMDRTKDRYQKIDFITDLDDPLLSKEFIKIKITSNEDLLSILFDNVIGNIRNHAFNWNDTENRRIEISIAIDTDKNKLKIFISNTGNPFPSNFSKDDFRRKGIKKGETAGNGMGGYLIVSIIEYFDGQWSIIDEKNGENIHDTDLVTTFEISLPYHL